MAFNPHFTILILDMQNVLGTTVIDAVIEQAIFAELNASLLLRIRPDRIMLPLLSPSHDAIQVIERLEMLGYAGQITVVAPKLPRAQMVETELRALGPGARLTLLSP